MEIPPCFGAEGFFFIEKLAVVACLPGKFANFAT